VARLQRAGVFVASDESDSRWAIMLVAYGDKHKNSVLRKVSILVTTTLKMLKTFGEGETCFYQRIFVFIGQVDK
ncbi:MAG: hypothetical protein LH472_05795, partial [Pyrinomonadaceae bacterium]|nr:hypothetical protein [Pyrinomonadaceae bacterium]